jgi:hypothetical protein
MPRGGSVSGGGFILREYVGAATIGGVVVLCMALAYFWSKRPSGMIWQYAPQVSGLDQIPDSVPTLKVLSKCRKCGYKMTGEPCKHCGSCSQCRAEDRCGECQQGFERQISLSERSRPCIICHSKPCKCPTATGKPVEKEPSVSRSGVYAEHVVFDY